MRRELKIGLGLLAVYFTLGELFEVPSFILGILFGIALCFMTIGVLPVKAYKMLKNRKASLVK
jgi:hypothetical protein